MGRIPINLGRMWRSIGASLVASGVMLCAYHGSATAQSVDCEFNRTMLAVAAGKIIPAKDLIVATTVANREKVLNVFKTYALKTQMMDLGSKELVYYKAEVPQNELLLWSTVISCTDRNFKAEPNFYFVSDTTMDIPRKQSHVDFISATGLFENETFLREVINEAIVITDDFQITSSPGRVEIIFVAKGHITNGFWERYVIRFIRMDSGEPRTDRYYVTLNGYDASGVAKPRDLRSYSSMEGRHDREMQELLEKISSAIRYRFSMRGR